MSLVQSPKKVSGNKILGIKLVVAMIDVVAMIVGARVDLVAQERPDALGVGLESRTMFVY